ncbi:unnamed protein product [Hydatigera taeniaeformis]|uniref:Shugoshin_C domain-containing protein n=1 Tax=Hydatigena taeniaeformis TaxID=6205 RepID=A0A0R3WNW9_HYDTA|nr:unnamed protein product [Hydatigera taeniaeformis]
MGDRIVLESQQRSRAVMSGKDLTDHNMIRQVLRICQKIESQVASLTRLEAENNRLTASLNHVETNFLTLLRTSQIEIAKLKHNPQNTAKRRVWIKILAFVFSCAHSNHRSKGISTLDPRRVIDHEDLIECLHTPLNCKRTTDGKHVVGLRCGGRSFSPSSASSTASFSSSSSSLSSSSASACQKQPRSYQLRHSLPLPTSASRRPSDFVSSLNSPSGSRNHFSAENDHVLSRNYNSSSCLVSKSRVSIPLEPALSAPVSEVKLREPKVTERHLKPTMADASTGIENGPGAHLMRLVRASIRSSREHHSASVKFAPPTRGKCLDESEKAIVDAYFHAEEERCMLASKRPRSHSPQRSLLFSPTLFARRRMLKHSSLCSPDQSLLCNINVNVSSRAPQSTNANHTEAALKRLGSASYPVSSASAAIGTSASRTPEGESKYHCADGEGTEVREKKQQPMMDAKTEVVEVTEREQEPCLDGHESRVVDSPHIEIEDNVSELDSHPDAGQDEAMSEGEVNDEEDDGIDDEICGERPNNNNNSHRRVHRGEHNRDYRCLRHHTDCSTALRHSSPKSIQHKTRHRVITSHERRRNGEGLVESMPSKRSRRLPDERESYVRFRKSPSRRVQKHPRISVSRPPVSISFRRFLSTSSGGEKFGNVMVHRTRHSPAFVSHRSSDLAFRSSRRAATQRSFVHRR